MKPDRDGLAPLFVRLSDQWSGPDPLYRWNLLQAAAWIATRDIRWVKGIAVQLADRGGVYWGDGPPTAELAHKTLQTDLHLHRATIVMPYTTALGQLLAAIRGDLVCFDQNGSASSPTALGVVGLALAGADIGLEVAQGEADRWRRVQLEVADVLGRWPGPDAIRTGDPGRPAKSAELYMLQFELRAASGQTEAVLADEATALLAWLGAEHRAQPQPTIGTIKNRIRAKHRALRTN